MTFNTETTIAAIATAIALLTYILNSCSHRRNKKIENINRFLQAHSNLFKEGFLYNNIHHIDNGSFKRNTSQYKENKEFYAMLGLVEHLALLTSHKAVPISVQVYMFGFYAKEIQKMLTPQDRGDIFWELAISYIDELVKATKDYEKLPEVKRAKILKKESFNYKKFNRF